MSISAVVGLQWGDEGKAKIVDALSRDVDYVVRFQGGANAGHTVVVGGKKYVFHLVPAGVLQPEAVSVVGNGVVFDPEAFFSEIEMLETEGIKTEGRVFVSDRCHIVMPYHRAADAGAEDMAGQTAIGTTRRGIGPTYADKARRRHAFRLADLLDKKNFSGKLQMVLQEKIRQADIYGSKFELDFEEVLEKFETYRERLRPYAADTVAMLRDAVAGGKNILLEGAQGVMLDVDFGTYPFVTSSNTVTSGAATGTGISLRKVDRIVGLAKSYTTRVGEGPFPTELLDETGNRLRDAGGEYGATTGRPRRCGWIDLVALKYAIYLADADEIALTKLDVLSGMETVKACVAYETANGRTTEFPALADDVAAVSPVYESFPGWKEDISGAKSVKELPAAALDYISFLEETLSTPIKLVSVGAARDEMLEFNSGEK